MTPSTTITLKYGGKLVTLQILAATKHRLTREYRQGRQRNRDYAREFLWNEYDLMTADADQRRETERNILMAVALRSDAHVSDIARPQLARRCLDIACPCHASIGGQA